MQSIRLPMLPVETHPYPEDRDSGLCCQLIEGEATSSLTVLLAPKL
jgi:hypothetical protein